MEFCLGDKAEEILIPEKDLEIQAIRSGGAGKPYKF